MKENGKKKVLKNASLLEQTLLDFGVEAKVNQVTVGPTITRYEIQPSPGVKVSKIVNLTDDIALSLAARSIRMEAPIPGKSAIGIEVPNEKPLMVGLREVFESEEFKKFDSPLAMALGKDISDSIYEAFENINLTGKLQNLSSQISSSLSNIFGDDSWASNMFKNLYSRELDIINTLIKFYQTRCKYARIPVARSNSL